MTVDDAGVPPWARHHVPKFEALLRSLERVPGFIIQPLELPSRDGAEVLATWLTANGRPARWIAPTDEPSWRALAAALSEPPGDTRAIVVSGPDDETSGMRHGLAMVNLHRDGIARNLGCPLLWCGPPEFLRATWEEAPDFWSIAAIPKQFPRDTDHSWIPLVDVDWNFVRETDIDSLLSSYGAARDQGDTENQIRLGARLIAALGPDRHDIRDTISREIGKYPFGPAMILLPLSLRVQTRDPLVAILSRRETSRSPQLKAQFLLHLGVISRRSALPEDACKELTESIQLFEQTGDAGSETLARLKLAELQLFRGDIAEVENHVRRITYLLGEISQDKALFEHACLVLTILGAVNERYTVAVAVAANLRATDDGTRPSFSAARAHVEGCLRARVGDFIHGQDNLSEALALYEVLGNTDGTSQVQRTLAAIRMAPDRNPG
jgi:hypothetical protein